MKNFNINRVFHDKIFGRSTLEKILIILLGITLGLLMAINSGKETRDVCTTQECVLSASRLLEGLNPSVDPCDDFYEYACGKWEDAHFRPLNEENSWIIERTEYIHYQIKKILEDAHNSSDIKPVQQMKLLYKMCMDTEHLNELGLDPLYNILDALELPRGLPNDLSAENFNLARTLALVQRLLNFDIFIKLSIGRNDTISPIFLGISPSINEFLLLDHEEEIKDTAMELFCQLTCMVDVMSEFNTNDSFSMDEIITDALKIIHLEKPLTHGANQMRDQIDEKSFMTLAQLQEYMFSNATKEAPFSWQDYISVLTENLNVNLTMNHVVCVENLFYFQTLGSRLITLKKEFFQRFVWWKVVDSLAIHTTNVIRTHRHILEECTFKGISKPSRSSDCINVIKPLFTELISHEMFTSHKHNVSAIIKKVNMMTAYMKTTFKHLIFNSVWLDDRAKHLRIEKIKTLNPIMGYTERSSNSYRLAHRYRNVIQQILTQCTSIKLKFNIQIEVLSNEFLKSVINIQAQMFDDLLSSLNGSYIRQFDDNESSWLIDPLEINAYYREEMHALVIPYSFLQFPFYTENIPALNFGGIGAVIGHELNHISDDEKFLHFEQQLTQQDKTKVEYEKRFQCFVKQYNNFRTADNTAVNDVETLSENIADNEGIRAAYISYEKYSQKRYGVEPLLPSFEKFTNQQLFFLSYANMWCKKGTGSKLDDMLVYDRSPNRFRVIGPLANLAEFSKTWNCPSTSPMNPKTKCTIY